MASYHQQLQNIFKRYEDEVSKEPADLREVGAWAMKQSLWAPRPIDVLSRFAQDMADALREEYRTDSKGRRYRSKLAVTGRQGSLWGDSDTAPRSHVVKSTGQRRRQIVGDCLQLRIDVDHYNTAHPTEEEIPLVLDFTDDVEELLIAYQTDDDKKAG